MVKKRIVKDKNFYSLDVKKHGVGGLTTQNPKSRKEDKKAVAQEAYAVVFFPQFELGWKAAVGFCRTVETLSRSPEAAKVKFLDGIGGEETSAEKWKMYSKAGHRIRKIKIVDMGPA